MIDLDIVLLESQTFRVSTAEALSDHKQLRYPQVNDLAARYPHADELTLEVELLEGLDANALAPIGAGDESLALTWNHAVVSVQPHPGLAVGFPIISFDQFQVAAQQFLDGGSLRLERGRAIKHLHH